MTDKLPPRVIGRYPAEPDDGPTVIAVGSIHGNEPAGVAAIGRVLQILDEQALPMRGQLLGLVGHRQAYAAGRRFMRGDLNRRWDRASVAALAAQRPAQDDAEQREQRALLEVFEREQRRTASPLVFVDLHSTSARGAPFACVGDSRRDCSVALSLGVPVLVGLERVITGAMLQHVCDDGHVGVAVEGGQHDDADTVDCHVAALGAALVAAGCLPDSERSRFGWGRGPWASLCENLPKVLDIIHRHVVREADDFKMSPGFRNFDPIERGQLLAHDRNGEIRAPVGGYIMMPKYQAQGEDGYFVVAPVDGVPVSATERIT